MKVLDLDVNSIYTLTTLNSGLKGKPSVDIPRSERFPGDFYDNYDCESPLLLNISYVLMGFKSLSNSR